MPHTTTKNSRVKRVDVRPNANQRKVMAKLKHKNETIQDLRVTRKPKDEIKEREVQGELKSTKTQNEKIIRSIRKKLTAIDELIARQSKGEELDEQQLEKISKLESLLTDMEKYT